MVYHDIETAVFIERPNRFIARVMVDGRECIAHVRNTGRCRELLLPGSRVILQKHSLVQRKTQYTLIGVYKGDMLVNIDSLAPNQVVYDALVSGGIEPIGPVDVARKEVSYGKSRFDMYFEAADRRGYIEVKGVTLERDGVAMFPDAPTSRGVRHISEMAAAVREGYAGFIIFLIQLQGVRVFRPNEETDPAFAEALRQAANHGVRVLAFDSVVAPGRTAIGAAVPVLL